MFCNSRDVWSKKFVYGSPIWDQMNRAFRGFQFPKRLRRDEQGCLWFCNLLKDLDKSKTLVYDFPICLKIETKWTGLSMVLQSVKRLRRVEQGCLLFFNLLKDWDQMNRAVYGCPQSPNLPMVVQSVKRLLGCHLHPGRNTWTHGTQGTASHYGQYPSLLYQLGKNTIYPLNNKFNSDYI